MSLNPSIGNITLNSYNSVEDYARQWEQEDVCTLSEWAKSVRIQKFKDPNVVEHLFHLRDKYVVVPADKAFKF